MHARRPTLLVLTLLVAVGFATPAPATTPVAPPAPDAIGPRPVGHTKLDLVDEGRGNRTFELQLWYPIDPDQANGKAAFYRLGFGTLGLSSQVAFEGKPPALRPFMPLVVFSHGSGGINVQSIGLMEALASHGFVVASPNHTGNTALDVLQGTTVPFLVSAVDRPQDVSFVIDTLARWAADPASPWYFRVNTWRVGAAGHSFGGYTALAMASGFQAVPPDPRVRAILPIAPASFLLSDAELAAIDVPLLVLGGTLDTTTPLVPNSSRPFDLVAGRPVMRVDISGATHVHFANVCDIGNLLLGAGLEPDFVYGIIPDFLEACGPGAYPVEEAQRIQALYAVSFFRRHLNGDLRYERYLRPSWAAAHEPAVSFSRKDPELPLWWIWWLSLFLR